MQPRVVSLLMRWTFTVLVAVLLAGCSDDPAPAGDRAPEPTQDALDSAVQPVLVTVQTAQAFSWAGHTKEGFFVCTGPHGTGSCPAGQQIQPDNEHTAPITFEHNLTSAIFNLTWTAIDASQFGLVFAAYDGAGQLLGVVEGPGTLTLELGEPTFPGDGSAYLIVWPSPKAGTDPSVYVDATKQPFTVEGWITTERDEWQMPEQQEPAR